jgi:hypothetical protein
LLKTSKICNANSRNGDKIIAATPSIGAIKQKGKFVKNPKKNRYYSQDNNYNIHHFNRYNCSKIGIKNASVLPLPVSAAANTYRHARFCRVTIFVTKNVHMIIRKQESLRLYHTTHVVMMHVEYQSFS